MNPRDRRKTQQPTWTSLVLALLTHTDDFMPMSTLCEQIPGLSISRACASLTHLKQYRVVDSVIGNDNKLWWFATGEDTRIRTCEMRTPEESPRATRRGCVNRVKKVEVQS